MTYREYIERKKTEWIGERVSYKGVVYTVIDVDYNGCLLIDAPRYYHDSYTSPTTAIEPYMLDKKGN